MTRSASAKRTPLKVVVTVLAIVVVLVFIAAFSSIANYSKGFSAEYDVRDYVYSAEYGRYGELYETTVRDMAKDTEHKPEVEEYRALAFYYEQAVLEHAYRTVGDAEKADGFAARMKEYETQLGSVSKRADDVREIVGNGKSVQE